MNYKRLYITIFVIISFILPGIGQPEDQSKNFVGLNTRFLPINIIDVYFPFGKMYKIPEDEKISGYIKRASNYESSGDLRQAYRYYSYAYQRARNTPISPYILFKRAYTVKDEKVFIRELKNILTNYPLFPFANAVRFELSLFLYLNNSIDESIYYAEQIIQHESSPFLPYALTLRASIYLKKENYESAIQDFFRSVSILKSIINGKEYEYQLMNNYLGLAVSYLGLKNFRVAEIILKKVFGTTSIDKVREKALFYLYEVYRKSDRNDLAMACYDTFNQDFPESIYLLKIKKEYDLNSSSSQNNSKNYGSIGIRDESILYGIDNVEELINLNYNRSPKEKVKKTDGVKFSVQIGSFKDESNAKKIMQRVLHCNYPVYIERIKSGKNFYFRVKVGPFDTKDEALTILRELKKCGIEGFVLRAK